VIVPTEGPSSPSILTRLQEPGPMVSVELRPPRSRLTQREGMDAWIDLRHSIQKLARSGTPVFLTDNAVGSHEEENLTHLSFNLGREMGWDRVVPFLTCKHPLEYCLLFAKRARSIGFPALTVLGGDDSVGPPRCVPHANELRRLIREQVPELILGGWANPHRDAEEQVEFVARGDFNAEFLLTQVVSHHSLEAVERFLEVHGRRTPGVPPVFGVFYYRSANPDTLSRLSRFFPVPAAQVAREFAHGATPDQVCARTVRALREAGAEKIYVSNLGFRRVPERLGRILAAV
jgi:hypothetical protein